MSLRVFQDTENQGAAMQTRNAAKQRTVAAENQAQKRTALGQLTNNVRQQPSRAAKVSRCDLTDLALPYSPAALHYKWNSNR